MTLKNKSRLLGFALLILVLLIIMIGMQSCGVNYHLRKSDRHMKKAILKGAIVKADTVYKTITVYTPKIEFDTVLRQVNFRDTITVEKDKVITRLKIDTITKEIYVSTECPPDTIRVEVPVSVENHIKTPRGFWYYFQFIAIALIVGFILGVVFSSAFRLWLKSF